jgi:hypothetical protein
MSSVTDWISATASVISALGVLIGLAFAWRQLHNWRSQSRNIRRAEVAEDIIGAAHSIIDLMKGVRSRRAQIPIDQSKNKTYLLEQRLKRLSDGNEIFIRLRDLQIKASQLIQDTKVDREIEKFFQARLDFWSGVDVLVDYVDVKRVDISADEKQMILEARQKTSGSFDSKDALHTVMKDALVALECYLGPIIRLNE